MKDKTGTKNHQGQTHLHPADKRDLTPIILTDEIPPLTDEVIETALGDSILPQAPTESSSEGEFPEMDAAEISGSDKGDSPESAAIVFEPIEDKDETKDIEKTQAFDLDAGLDAAPAQEVAGFTPPTETPIEAASTGYSPKSTSVKTETQIKPPPPSSSEESQDQLGNPLLEKIQQNSRLFAKTPGSDEEEDHTVGYGDTASLRIAGQLRPHERDRLLYILSKENVNIREFDLESQWESGAVLIPHVSEYVLMLIVQSLKDAAVRLERIPSEVDPEREIHEAPRFAERITNWSGKEESTVEVVILPDELESLEDLEETFEWVEASAILPELYVGAEKENLRLEEAILRLKNHLKARAHSAGANALVQVQVKINPIYHRQETHVVVSGIPVLKKM